MLQRNVTGYPIVVQPPDGSHRDPFELAPGEDIDYPDPIVGCAAEAPGAEVPDVDPVDPPPGEPPVDEPPAEPAAPARGARKSKTTDPAPAADGGDPA